MKRLTEAIAAELRDKAVAGGRDAYEFDSVAPGYFLRATPAGAVTHNAQARIAGRKPKITVGYWSKGMKVTEGRELARLAIADLRGGRDPALERRARQHATDAASITIKQFTEEWMATHARPKLKPKTVDDYGRMLTRYILPRLGNRTVAELSWSDVVKLHTGMKDKPRSANMTVDLIRIIMAHAVKAGLRKDNPARDVTRYRESPRERFLAPAEFARAVQAIDGAVTDGTIGPHAGAGLKLALYTGARRGEIHAACWSQVDWTRRFIRLPDSKGNVPRTLHLSEPALDVLRALPRHGPHIIGGGRGFLTVAWMAVRKRCGLDDVRLHDLRHSFASTALAAGTSLPMIGRLLGHKLARTTQRYAHLAADDVAAANDAVGEALAAMSTPPPRGAVVKLSTKRRGRR
jgi:integrase